MVTKLNLHKRSLIRLSSEGRRNYCYTKFNPSKKTFLFDETC